MIELLTVVAIVALLIGLLLPALGFARARASLTRCLVGVGEQARVGIMFSDEHAGRLQIAGRIFTSDLDRPDELRDLETYTESGEFETTVRPLPVQAALAPYLGGRIRSASRVLLEKDLQDEVRMERFVCPSDTEVGLGRVLANQTLSWSAPMARSSYGFNDAVLGIHPSSGPRAYGYLRLVTRPAETLLFADAEPRAPEHGFTPHWLTYFNQSDTTTLADCLDGTDGGSPSVFPRDRHGDRLNVSFVDGHARSVSIGLREDLESVGIARGVLDAAR